MKTNLGKRALPLLLSLLILIGLVPTTAFAAGGEKILESNKQLDISALTEATDKLDEEGWKWEPSETGGVLTLKNCHIICSQSNSSVLGLPGGNVTIRLEGNNTLETTANEYNPMIAKTWGAPGEDLNLTIEGASGGKLNILRQNTNQTTRNPYGIAARSLTITSGEIYTNVNGLCIVPEFSMHGGSVTVDAANQTDAQGIHATGGVDITGGVVNIQAGSRGIHVPGTFDGGDKTIAITGGTVTVSAELGLLGANILINTTGSVDITGSAAGIVLAEKMNGKVEILSAGTIKVEGFYEAVGMNGNPGKPNIAGANYEAVNAAIAKAEELDPDMYKDFSAVTEALAAVDEGKNLLEQAEVNAMAEAIEDAIDALEYKAADYSKVDEAIAKVEALNKDEYKDFSAVEEAVAAVVRNKNITEQTTVDGYATAIENAISALEYKAADYSKVDEAIAKAEALKKDEYKDFSAVEAAINAVVRGKNITEQAEVDAMAKAINDAIASLEKKPDTKPGNTESPQTGDSSNVALWIAVMLMSGTALTGAILYNRKKKYSR